jgi:hypothetical protein
MANDFSNKVSILAELWMNYRDDDQMRDFIEYNDLGLPLAYLLLNDIVVANENSETYIDETYGLLVAALQVKDKAYESLDEMLDSAPLA